MEAQQVIEKILADASKEVERITNEAAQIQSSQQAQLERQVSEYRQETELLAQKAATEKHSRMAAAARMENSLKYLAQKRQILKEVFEEAKSRFAQLPDDQYRDIMKKYLMQAVETGDEEVIIGKHENRIDQSLIDHVNSELNEKGNLKLSSNRQDIAAGFILSRGKIKTNVSLEVLLDQARTELEVELSKMLFE